MKKRIDYDNGYYEGDAAETQGGMVEHGRGTYYWNDGERYEGEWRDNKKHGRGTYYWSDGDRYEGEFCDGKSTDGAYIIGVTVTDMRANTVTETGTDGALCI